MHGMHLPIDIVHLLEDRLGREEGRKVAEAIEAGIAHLEAKSHELSLQRKIEAKAELKVELREELATKEDVARLREQFKEELAKVRERMANFEGRLEGIERLLKESVATKADLVKLEAKFEHLEESVATKADLVATKLETRLLWLTTIFLIVFLNQNALEFIARLMGLVK